MSLNGLDAPEVQDIYSTTLNEAGGWFFLKYVSRDEVALLDAGKGGVLEARTVLGQYEDLSPLYGLIMYRRKKALIKFVPEGTSRLLQARTTVHLQDVLEKYAPYEAMVEITCPEALSDTTLAAAFPLHTAAPSIKGNTLDEITEDAEEQSSPRRMRAESPAPAPSVRKASTERWPSRRAHTTSPQPSVDLLKSAAATQKSSVSRFLVREEAGQHSVTELDAPLAPEPVSIAAQSNDSASILSGNSEHSVEKDRTQTGLSENGELDFDKYYAELYKPKTRLAPRPVTLTAKGRRPLTSSIPSHSRPVSAMPTSLHTRSDREGSSHSNSHTSSDVLSTSLPPFPQPPPIPGDATFPRPGSRGSARSLPLSTMSVKTSKSTMTPEKMRLMKAMELRRKQKRKSTPPESIVMSPVPEHDTFSAAAAGQREGTTTMHEAASKKADSGIEVDGVTSTDTKLDSAQNSIPSQKTAGEHEHKVAGPRFVDSPMLGRNVDSAGFLPRSPALSSLPAFEPPTQSAFPAGNSVSAGSGHDIDDTHEKSTIHGDSIMVSTDATAKTAALLEKRRGWVEPLTINVDVTPLSDHEHNYLSDEDFLEELQSATFQEAKPMLMHRSPASPFFPPRRPSARSARSAQSVISAASGTSLASVVNGTMEHSSPASSNGADDSTVAVAAGHIEPSIEPKPLSVETMEPAAENMSLPPAEPLEPTAESTLTPIDSAAASTSLPAESTSLPTESAPLAVETTPTSVEPTPLPVESMSPPVESTPHSTEAPLPSTETTPLPADSTPLPAEPAPPPAEPTSLPTEPTPLSAGPTSVPAESRPATAKSEARSDTQDSVHTKASDSDAGDFLAAPRNRQVSSGISMRIQALAEKARREAEGGLAPPVQNPRTSFIGVRKASVRKLDQTQASTDKPASRLSVWPAPSPMHTTPNNLAMNRALNRESVSVTARIVRQPVDRAGGASSPTELLHSPILINHTRPNTNHEFPPMAPMLDHGATQQPEDERTRDRSLSPTFSYSSVDSGATNGRNTSASPNKADHDSPRQSPTKNGSTLSLASDDSGKQSRTSRFFKRISHIGGGRRKSLAPQPMFPSAESPAPESSAADPVAAVPASEPASEVVSESTPEPALQAAPKLAPAVAQASDARTSKRKDSVPDIPPPIIIGDLNVQFPDTLLWKRRWVEVDPEGNLIFTASRPASNATGGTGRGFVTKFHLKELNAPYIPDVDRQEMPNSVLFDLSDGATLSCSSEDSMAQRQLLSLLTTYHQAWQSVA
ncbi:hypothetical protein AAFC00_003216 [Neodothiora populina]|uniref:GPI-anchored cell surface glycoprotein n=1 Tax=Neodothiora populina TaxID=2781224 RepID=A0ABR3P9S5_9PEZI